MTITSTPIILITWFLIFVNYLLTKEKQIQQTYENLIIQDDVTFDVED
jgi:TM2 domain-containing membrane protein YozV